VLLRVGGEGLLVVLLLLVLQVLGVVGVQVGLLRVGLVLVRDRWRDGCTSRGG